MLNRPLSPLPPAFSCKWARSGSQPCLMSWIMRVNFHLSGLPKTVRLDCFGPSHAAVRSAGNSSYTLTRKYASLHKTAKNKRAVVPGERGEMYGPGRSGCHWLTGRLKVGFNWSPQASTSDYRPAACISLLGSNNQLVKWSVLCRMLNCEGLLFCVIIYHKKDRLCSECNGDGRTLS